MSSLGPGARLAPHPEFGFPQVQPTPTPDVIDEFYRAHFYSGEYKRFNNSSSAAQAHDREFNDAHRDDIWMSLLAANPGLGEGGRVLDVGCGYGQALEYFRAKGLAPFGFDPSPEAVEHGQAAGLNVVQAGMDRIDLFDERFELVTIFHVLEHLADPVEALRTIRRAVIAHAGLIVVEVPNEFNAFQVAGRAVHELPEWWVTPPAHLNYFNSSTLAATLRGCGFDVLALRSTFPMEMFLLMGSDYVRDPAVGAQCHERRVAFERNLRRTGHEDVLQGFYSALGDLGLGRTIVAVARAA